MNKIQCISASLYYENTITIPFTRLSKIIKKGDIIRGNCNKIRISASYVEYIVTFVDHWGVYAVPTIGLLEHLKKSHNKDYLNKMNYFKGHIKFKWCNIKGIIFKE